MKSSRSLSDDRPLFRPLYSVYAMCVSNSTITLCMQCVSAILPLLCVCKCVSAILPLLCVCHVCPQFYHYSVYARCVSNSTITLCMQCVSAILSLLCVCNVWSAILPLLCVCKCVSAILSLLCVCNVCQQFYHYSVYAMCVSNSTITLSMQCVSAILPLLCVCNVCPQFYHFIYNLFCNFLFIIRTYSTCYIYGEEVRTSETRTFEFKAGAVVFSNCALIQVYFQTVKVGKLCWIISLDFLQEFFSFCVAEL